MLPFDYQLLGIGEGSQIVHKLMNPRRWIVCAGGGLLPKEPTRISQRTLGQGYQLIGNLTLALYVPWNEPVDNVHSFRLHK